MTKPVYAEDRLGYSPSIPATDLNLDMKPDVKSVRLILAL